MIKIKASYQSCSARGLLSYPALITHSPHWYGTNHAIRSQRYHYIHYADGAEELYDNTTDPYGWKNLADDPKYAQAKEKLKERLPKMNAEHFRPEATTRKPVTFGIAPDSAALIVIAPVKGKIIHRGNKTLIDNVVVDFPNNAAQETSTCKFPD